VWFVVSKLNCLKFFKKEKGAIQPPSRKFFLNYEIRALSLSLSLKLNGSAGD
jgi:hypothetical protein